MRVCGRVRSERGFAELRAYSGNLLYAYGVVPMSLSPSTIIVDAT